MKSRFLLAVLTSALVSPACTVQTNPLVRTTSGLLQGVEQDGGERVFLRYKSVRIYCFPSVMSFKGIVRYFHRLSLGIFNIALPCEAFWRATCWRSSLGGPETIFFPRNSSCNCIRTRVSSAVRICWPEFVRVSIQQSSSTRRE